MTHHCFRRFLAKYNSTLKNELLPLSRFLRLSDQFSSQTISDLDSPVAYQWLEFIQIKILQATTITVLKDIFVQDKK